MTNVLVGKKILGAKHAMSFGRRLPYRSMEKKAPGCTAA